LTRHSALANWTIAPPMPSSFSRDFLEKTVIYDPLS
jgi:hypothetical protein